MEKSGRHEEARAWAERAAAMTDSTYGAYNLACYHAVAGHRQEALHRLRRSIDLGFGSAWITKDTDLDSLRGDPEFEAMLTEVMRKIGKE